MGEGAGEGMAARDPAHPSPSQVHTSIIPGLLKFHKFPKLSLSCLKVVL